MMVLCQACLFEKTRGNQLRWQGSWLNRGEMGSDASPPPVAQLWAICYGSSSGKNMSGVRDSLVNVGKGYEEDGKVL